jgi:LmbE family N-acetylglucosaminyl deacetylase
MAPERAGPLREIGQRRSAAIVGVNHVEFWDFPDSEIVDCAELRAAITEAIVRLAPELVLTIYSGPEWGPGEPNQRDHIEFAKAVAQSIDSMERAPRWFFENGPDGTHAETVDGFVDIAVESLCAHQTYLSVLEPDVPVEVQARAQVERSTPPCAELGGLPAVEFILKRRADP